jgi:hypothetical protein
MQERVNAAGAELKEASPSYRASAAGISDEGSPSLEDSLAMTPWERILANDDMVNFGDSLRAAMAKRNAKPR